MRVEDIPVDINLKSSGPNYKDSEIVFSAEFQLKPYVVSSSESNNGTNSSSATALATNMTNPVKVNEFSKSVSVTSNEIVASQYAPLEKYSFDLAQLAWVRGKDIEYKDRSFSLIIGFTSGRIYDANKKTKTTYTNNTQHYSNGTSSSSTMVESEELPGISLGERSGGCGGSLAFNVFKEYDDFTVTYAMGVAYGFMTDEAKQLAKQYATSKNLAYFPADSKSIGGRMTFVNSTDVIDGAWLGINFSF